MLSRIVARLAAAVVLTAAVPLAAVGQTDYPSKPVRIIVPFSPGGATDIVTRLLAQRLSEAWKQSVVVENRAGAAGNIGAAEVAKAAPDGYTLFMTTGSIVTANQFIYKPMPFDAEKDLAPITIVCAGPQLVIVPASSPYKTLKELIAAAKASPGTLNYGHAGIGSQTHLAAENFLYAAGIEVTNVPYKGEGPAVTDVIAGQLNMAAVNMPAAVNFVRDGKLRALGVTSKERIPQMPDVPAVAETLKGFENSGWFALMAPAGTPKAIIEKVQRDTVKALESTELKARLYVIGMAPVGNTPEQFARVMRDESRRWAEVVKQRNITVK
jgi:tripartite-type tricarboxylate transporter receptor subunit TctC